MNKHYDDAQLLISEAALTDKWGHEESIVTAMRAHATATLALAYEQRTANLIAPWTAPAKNAEGIYDKGEELAGVSYGRIAAEIKERLNLA